MNAPFASQWTFCAASRMRLPASAARDGVERGEGRGDQHLAIRDVAPTSRRARRRARSPRRACRASSSCRRAAGRVRAHVSPPARRRRAACSPSRNSSDAPPPVEMCVMRSALPELHDRRDRVAAADDGDAPCVATSASAIAIVPAANGVDLEDAHRAVPEDRARRRDLRRVRALAVSGPMSTPSRSAGKSPAHDLGAARRPRARSATTWSTGSSTRTPFAAARASVSRARSILSSSTRDPPTGYALRAQERVRHRAADRRSVCTRSSRLLDDADLVRHLGAAEDGDERPLPAPAAPAESTRPPAAAGSRRRARARSGTMPAVEACARCAVPKASLT